VYRKIRIFQTIGLLKNEKGGLGLLKERSLRREIVFQSEGSGLEREV